MRVSKIWDGADPGGTPGRVFTGSINQETIVAEGPFFDHMKMGVKGAVSTAAVVIETFAGLISEYSFRVGADVRLSLSLQDLCALMEFYYHKLPTIGENTDATGNDYIGGLKIPVQEKTDINRPFTHYATRAAQTNIATETVALTGYFTDSDGGKKPIHAVLIQHTSAGTAGYETLGFKIVPVGKLIGLILAGPAAGTFTDGNIDTSVQRIRILEDGKVAAAFNQLGDHTSPVAMDFVAPAPMADLLLPYAFYDLRPEGLDAKAKELTLQLDVEDVSDALRIIPVIEVE